MYICIASASDLSVNGWYTAEKVYLVDQIYPDVSIAKVVAECQGKTLVADPNTRSYSFGTQKGTLDGIWVFSRSATTMHLILEYDHISRAVEAERELGMNGLIANVERVGRTVMVEIDDDTDADGLMDFSPINDGLMNYKIEQISIINTIIKDLKNRYECGGYATWIDGLNARFAWPTAKLGGLHSTVFECEPTDPFDRGIDDWTHTRSSQSSLSSYPDQGEFRTQAKPETQGVFEVKDRKRKAVTTLSS